MIEIIINTHHPKALKRHRLARFGRMYDPSAKDKKKVELLIQKYRPERIFNTGVRVKYIFTFKRPKSHYRSGKFKDRLKKYAPYFHTITPDLDNVIKFYNDVIQMGFIKNDKLIYSIDAVKIYGKEPKVEIVIDNIITY